MDRLEFVFLNFSFVCSLSETVTKGGTVFDLVRFPKFRFPLSVKKIRDGGFLCTKIVHFFFASFFASFFGGLRSLISGRMERTGRGGILRFFFSLLWGLSY